jgi:hypothetical protein
MIGPRAIGVAVAVWAACILLFYVLLRLDRYVEATAAATLSLLIAWACMARWRR